MRNRVLSAFRDFKRCLCHKRSLNRKQTIAFISLHKTFNYRIAAIVLLLLMSAACFSQQQIVKHNDYTTYYDVALGEPDSVTWLLTPTMLNCTTHLARANKFIADPQIPNTNFNSDYSKSGYDQGHQFPAQDASCSTVDETECFFFSNMVPQRPNLNRITWKALEVYTRKVASTVPVTVTCGVIGSLGTIGKHNINIPKYCWKRLTYAGKVEYYVMPNVDSVKLHAFTYYRVK